MELAEFEELGSYVGLTEDDRGRLRALRSRLDPHLDEVVSEFYQAASRSPAASAVLSSSAGAALHLRDLLRHWLISGLEGPHDRFFLQERQRIGRAHVRVQLPQRFVFGAMSVLRTSLHRWIDALSLEPGEALASRDALDRWLDLELAIIIETYKNDSDEKLARSERLAAMGALAGTVAHEIRNPLSVISSSLFLLGKSMEEPSLGRHIEKIQAQVQHMAGVVTDLLELARDQPPKRERHALRSFLEQAATEIRLAEGLVLEVDAPEEAFGWFDGGLVRRAVVNLLMNAAAAMEGRSGRISVRGSALGDAVELVVSDEGPGFNQAVLDRLFEPLVSTRSSGSGLGLSLVRRVTARHGGTVMARNRPSGGAEVIVVLPSDSSLG